MSARPNSPGAHKRPPIATSFKVGRFFNFKLPDGDVKDLAQGYFRASCPSIHQRPP